MSDRTIEAETNRDDERSPWTRPGFLFAAAFAVLVVLALVGVLIATSGGPNQRPGTPPTAEQPPSGPQPDPDAADQTVPTAAPANVQWHLFHTVALPQSATAGPRQVTDSTAAGYAHSPTGALMAAANLPTRKVLAPDWRQVVDEQVMPGPGRDAYAAAREKLDHVEPAPGQFGQTAGFKFVNYTPQTATIQLVQRFISGNQQATTITVVWSEGDWKLQLQPDGGDSPTAQPVTDLSPYAPWGGV